MKQIVIAEDELFMREELSDILQKAGYEILEITEFNHVADQILTLSPDLALLDLGTQAEKRHPCSGSHVPGPDAG